MHAEFLSWRQDAFHHNVEKWDTEAEWMHTITRVSEINNRIVGYVERFIRRFLLW